MEIEHKVISHAGARPQNEDSYMSDVTETGCLFAVADGLGGLPGGQWASSLFCQALKALHSEYIEQLIHNPYQGCPLLIKKAAAMMIEDLKDIDYPHAYTTTALVWLDSEHTVAAHIGDSRIYYFDQTGLKWRSRDHSYAQQLVDAGIITEAEMAHHPSQAYLLRTIGEDEMIEPDVALLPPFKAGHSLLLCTDGFWEWTSIDTMYQLCQADDLEAALKTHVENILEQAEELCDNITVQVIRAHSHSKVKIKATEAEVQVTMVD